MRSVSSSSRSRRLCCRADVSVFAFVTPLVLALEIRLVWGWLLVFFCGVEVLVGVPPLRVFMWKVTFGWICDDTEEPRSVDPKYHCKTDRM